VRRAKRLAPNAQRPVRASTPRPQPEFAAGKSSSPLDRRPRVSHIVRERRFDVSEDREAGIYAFDELDEQLSLLPMAARRALDLAGVHLSLVGWQRLSLEQRRQLIAQGAAEVVAVESVRRGLQRAGAPLREEDPRADPASDLPPAELADALGSSRQLTAADWTRLSALDRYVLAQLARRGKRERLAIAYDEIAERRLG
jgi:hypothetical protein